MLYEVITKSREGGKPVRRMIAVAGKEAREILRDPVTLGIAILLPVIMMFLFAYAITLDVREIRLAVLDQDRTAESREYLSAFFQSGYFRLEAYARNSQELGRLLLADSQRHQP